MKDKLQKKKKISNVLLKESHISFLLLLKGLVYKGTGGKLFSVLLYSVEYIWIFLVPSGL